MDASGVGSMLGIHVGGRQGSGQGGPQLLRCVLSCALHARYSLPLLLLFATLPWSVTDLWGQQCCGREVQLSQAGSCGLQLAQAHCGEGSCEGGLQVLQLNSQLGGRGGGAWVPCKGERQAGFILNAGMCRGQ